MAVKIRLRRMGAKKNPFYRIVVADSRYPRDGRFIEEIGTYDPLKTPADVKIDADKAKQWIANGAQPTDTVKDILKKRKAMDLRGMLDAISLMRKGIAAREALTLGITNKIFDSYEQELISDMIAARIPSKLKVSEVFKK